MFSKLWWKPRFWTNWIIILLMWQQPLGSYNFSGKTEEFLQSKQSLKWHQAHNLMKIQPFLRCHCPLYWHFSRWTPSCQTLCEWYLKTNRIESLYLRTWSPKSWRSRGHVLPGAFIDFCKKYIIQFSWLLTTCHLTWQLQVCNHICGRSYKSWCFF